MQWTGLPLVKLVQLRIKANVVHAGPSQQLVLLSLISLLPMVVPFQTILNNNLSPAHQLTETPVATVVGTTLPGTIWRSPLRKTLHLIPIPPVQLVLMVLARQTPPLVKLRLLLMLLSVKQTLKLWLLLTFSPSVSLFALWAQPSNSTNQASLVKTVAPYSTMPSLPSDMELILPLALIISTLETHGVLHGVMQDT